MADTRKKPDKTLTAKGGWEAQNIDDILNDGHSGFADVVALEYVQRLLGVIDPKSQTTARIVGYFEDPTKFYALDREYFPARRAAYNERLNRYNATMRPLEQESARVRTALNEQRRLHEKAPEQERAPIATLIAELDRQNSKLSDELKLARLRKTRRYMPQYKRKSNGKLPVAKTKDFESLKALIAAYLGQGQKSTPHPVLANLETLGALFKWPELERDAVRFLWAVQNSDDFKRLINDAIFEGIYTKTEGFNHLLAAILGTNRRTISEMLSPGSELMLSGVLMSSPGMSDLHMPKFTDSLVKMLDQPDITLEKMLKSLVGEPASTRLDLNVNFNYVAEHIPHVVKLVKTAVEEGIPGKNIIVYGMQDSGKTEFTKALAKALSLPVFMLGETKAGHAEPSPQERLGQILLAKRLTAHMKGIILAVDEAEDLLKIREPGAERGDGVTKVYLNRLLEHGQMTVWIVNDIDAIHPSVRRRFKYSIPFGALTARDRLHAWKDITQEKGLSVPLEALEDLATKFTVPVGSIVTAVENSLMTTKDATALDRSLRATGAFVFDGLPAILSGDVGNVPFYPELQNFEETRMGYTPREFEEVIARHVDKPLAIFTHGPSGSGKKAFFRNLAQRTNREFLSYDFLPLLKDPKALDRLLSDASDKPCIIAWDGMAALNGVPETHAAINVIRGQIRQLTELLPCIHVFSSNIKDSPPQWAKQEFAFILKHDYLMENQIKSAWRKFFGSAMPAKKTGLDMNPLTPGHFATIVYRNRGLMDNLQKARGEELRTALDETSAVPAVQPPPLTGRDIKYRND